MAFNKNRIVIEADGPRIKIVATGKRKAFDLDGCRFDAAFVEKSDEKQMTLKPDTCRIMMNKARTKVRFDFGTSGFFMNLHHILRIYEKETGMTIWEKASVLAPHIIIAFTGVFLQEGPLPIGKGVFVGVNCAIPDSWIKSWSNNGPDAFIKFYQGCSVAVPAPGKEAQIIYGFEEVRIPLSNILEIYEKETGKRIWQKPIAPPATPAGGKKSTP